MALAGRRIAGFVAALLLMHAVDAFLPSHLPYPSGKRAILSLPRRASSGVQTRMAVDPSFIVDAAHAAQPLIDACGSAAACLADAASALPSKAASAAAGLPSGSPGAKDAASAAASAAGTAAAAKASGSLGPIDSLIDAGAALQKAAQTAFQQSGGGAPATKGAAAGAQIPGAADAGKLFEGVAKQLQGAVGGVAKALEKPLEPVLSAVKGVSSQASKATAPLAAEAGKVSAQGSAYQAKMISMLPKEVVDAAGQLEVFIRKVSRDSDKDLFNGYPFNAPALGIWFASVFAFSSVAWKDDEVPYGPGQYDPAKAEKYYRKRWAKLFGRGLQLSFILVPWGIGVLRDKYDFGGRDWEKNMPMRAKQLLQICTRLGTTAIKLGQAVSIRTDLLPAPYVAELSKLQDKVEPFPTTMSRQVLKEELGLEGPGQLERVFPEISPKPVASASIGQVYKAKLEDGTEVAVKVQRPDIIQDIALDLYISRTLLPIYKRAMNLNTDFVGLVDEWGAGFVNELDYVREARNGKLFLEAMQSRGLDAVTTAAAVPGLCSGRVLTTRWIDGERLERSTEEDVGRLCGVALNSYLTMLLDTGLLHCDPHPGNLLRTSDGRLAILDWGMCVEVEKDLQYTLLEYIAHLTVEDYEAIPYDLIRLGFVPKGKEDAFTRAGVVEVLSVMLRQLAQGGGPKQVQARLEEELKEEFGDLPREEMRKVLRERMVDMTKRDAATMLEAEGQTVNVNTVAQKMEELQQSSNVFQIPPWMAYILRTFTVLEGVGLNQDENYSITAECYPFLARRLLTDNSPRAQEALKQMLYGSAQKAGDAQVLDVERLTDLAKGFQDYTVSTGAVERSAGLDKAAGQVQETLLSPEGNFVQQVVLDEIVSALDALTRDAVSRVTSSGLGSAAVGALEQQRALSQQIPGPLRTLLTPVFLPGELALSALPLLAKDEQDEASLRTARALWDLIQERQEEAGAGGAGGGGLGSLRGLVPSDPDSVMNLLSSLSTARPGISATAARFGAVMLARVADRLEERLDDERLHLPDLTRQVSESFVTSADRVIVELEKIAASQAQARAGAAAGGGQEEVAV